MSAWTASAAAVPVRPRRAPTADNENARAAQSITEYLRDERRRAEAYWRDQHAAQLEERSFAEGQHFEDETEVDERRSQQLRFVGQETFNVIRHDSAQLTDAPRVIEARPAGPDGTPDDAELAVAILEAETGNPLKGFADCEDLRVTAAVASRIGVTWIDFDPDLGPWGEVLFRPVDAVKVMWSPGYHDPHDLRCDWMSVDETFRVSQLQDMFKGNRYANQDALANLKPEGIDLAGKTASGGGPASVEQRDVGDNVQDGSVRTTWWWLKNDRTTRKKPKRTLTLKPGERYMVCGAPGVPGCGWKGPTQAELGYALPEEEPGADEMAPDGGCPECGGPTMRVDQQDVEPSVLVYPKGKRLVIEAPDQKGLLEPLYDGPWPTMAYNPRSDVRSFPCYVYTRYLPSDPSKPTGPSQTFLNWSAQAASDYLVTKAFQSAAQYQRYYLMPESGINDYRGLRFEFRDEQFNVMYRSPSEAVAPGYLDVTAVDGSQFDPTLPSVLAMVQDKLLAHQGTADLGLTGPGAAKSIPATTVAQVTQQAEIPIEHARRRLRRANSAGHGVLWDYIRATYPDERLASLALNDGTQEVLNVRGRELGNFWFIESDTPTFTGLEKAKAEGFDRLMQFAQMYPDFLDEYAQVNKVPQSILDSVKKKLAARQAAMPMAPPAIGGGAPAQPGQAGDAAMMPEADAAPPPSENDPRMRAQAVENAVRATTVG